MHMNRIMVFTMAQGVVASLEQQSCVGSDAGVGDILLKSEAGNSRELARTRRALRGHNVESITNSQARTA